MNELCSLTNDMTKSSKLRKLKSVLLCSKVQMQLNADLYDDNPICQTVNVSLCRKLKQGRQKRNRVKKRSCATRQFR